MSQQYKFPITGMSCDGCRSAVEKALGNMTGVEKASVNLAEKTAIVDAVSEIPFKKFEDALANTHYGIMPYQAPLGENQHRYAVEGMTCQGCRSHVEEALKKVEGVTGVVVSLENKEAIITSDSEVPFERLKAVLDGTNYHIHPEGAVMNHSAHSEKKK